MAQTTARWHWSLTKGETDGMQCPECQRENPVTGLPPKGGSPKEVSLRLAQSETARVQALLAPIYHGFTEGFDTTDLQDAKVLLTSLDAAVRCHAQN